MYQPEHTGLRAAIACAVLLMGIAAQAQAQDQAQEPVQAQAPAQISSDRNVPAATAHRQAAEIARGDPARWHQEDRSVAERLRTIRKETAAGLQENLGNCRALPAAERSACVREARATYTLEMAGARARAASGN